MKLRFPTELVAITKNPKGHGYLAYDFGWSSKHGGANCPLYASGPGTVTWVRDGRNNDYPSNSYGNNLRVEYDNGVRLFYAHILKGSFLVKVGDRVTFGQELCRMNNSGNSRGSHLHLEAYDIVSNKRIDALTVLHAYDGLNTVGADTEKNYHILHTVEDEKDILIAELTAENERLVGRLDEIRRILGAVV